MTPTGKYKQAFPEPCEVPSVGKPSTIGHGTETGPSDRLPFHDHEWAKSFWIITGRTATYPMGNNQVRFARSKKALSVRLVDGLLRKLEQMKIDNESDTELQPVEDQRRLTDEAKAELAVSVFRFPER